MKKTNVSGAILCISLLFAGCTSSLETITEENAPTDVMKTLASIGEDSITDEISSSIKELVRRTGEAYNWRVGMTVDSDVTDYVVNDDKTLSAESTSGRSIDISLADDTQMYELLEQESADSRLAGLMPAGEDSTASIFAVIDEGDLDTGPQTLTVNRIISSDSQENESSDAKQRVKDTVSIPLYSYLGANLIIQPMEFPEYYSFRLQKRGDLYEWTISMKDRASYNEQLDSYVLSSYGYNRTDLNGDGSMMMDGYTTTSVSIVVSMDENGVISSIENTNRSTVGSKGNLVDVSSVKTVKVEGASESILQTMKDIFAKVNADELKTGDHLELGSLFESSDAAADDSSGTEGKEADSAEAPADDSTKTEETARSFVNCEQGDLSQLKTINDSTTKIVVQTESGRDRVYEYPVLLKPNLFRYGYSEGDIVWFTFETATASDPPVYSKVEPVFLFRNGLVDKTKILDPGIRKLLE